MNDVVQLGFVVQPASDTRTPQREQWDVTIPFDDDDDDADLPGKILVNFDLSHSLAIKMYGTRKPIMDDNKDAQDSSFFHGIHSSIYRARAGTSSLWW